MPADPIPITLETLKELGELRAKPKFHARGSYPGATNEETRTFCERVVNAMLNELVWNLIWGTGKSAVMDLFMKMLRAFDCQDTEEREEVCEYCGQVMEILGIDSSGGLLNRWLYGFDPANYEDSGTPPSDV